ncbi:MAG TPA: flagellar motor protein [Thermoleophilaceae bacterium]
MKAATAIGIGATLAGLLIGILMEGSSPAALINIPAALIVFVGTFGVTLAGTSMDKMKQIPALYKRAISPPDLDLPGRVDLLVDYAEKARRDGLLALDDQLSTIDDEFTRKGFQLVVDGTDPELVREILDNEIDGMVARHHASARPFEKAGGFAPTMGIIGTVLGLVHVLENLSAPETLGPSISGAFIATLFGVGAANVVFLPVSNKLKEISEEEVELRTVTVEGILAVQAGDNPRVVADKLRSFIAPSERDRDRTDSGQSGGGGDDAPAAAEPAQAAA